MKFIIRTTVPDAAQLLMDFVECSRNHFFGFLELDEFNITVGKERNCLKGIVLKGMEFYGKRALMN